MCPVMMWFLNFTDIEAMEEYVFETVTLIEWQKWLNQWRHDYKLEIVYIKTEGNDATILLKRTKKIKQMP